MSSNSSMSLASVDSLHLVEHVGEGRLELERLLDLVGADVRILAVFQEARALVLANELDERRGFVFQSSGNPSRFSKTVLMPYLLKRATASSVYLSKSVSKMPWYMK